MIWLFLEAIANPDGWAITIDKQGEIHIKDLADLPPSVRVFDLTRKPA